MSRHSSSQAGARSLRGIWSLALMGLVVLAAPQQAATASPQPANSAIAQANSSQSSQNRLPRAVARQVQRDLSQRLDIPRRNLEIVSFDRQTWPDSCLGLAAANERCATATVEGWRVELTNGQQNWVYRTDMTAQVIRLETNQNNDLLPEARDRLLQTIAQEESVSINSLRITEAQPRVWDGCMGIYAPDQACTRIAISGWQVIVAGEDQSWVYHLSEDGSRIVQNSTASGNLTPSFIPTDGGTPEPIDSAVVFRAVTSGGFAGIVSEVILTADGTIYRQVSQPSSPRPSDPVVESRLSPEQVEQFQQLLEDQRFPNLNGLRYITDVALADYPTTTFYAMGSRVEYIDLEQDNLPEALQEVVQAWNQF
ncbi:hypothetical protein H6F88_26590 [Oculatella sp. FACHB-28]|uniref:hypothetical protein n=1 Tax=Oculatella sp. FACHB-28 TaxID=2692845 RepID=UPI0016856194|nr:hypothetical protein [Oculatella sp. FACHB-28]MBD2059520.1 hypothetical protein [Oculatella sp. FACHB-28]